MGHGRNGGVNWRDVNGFLKTLHNGRSPQKMPGRETVFSWESLFARIPCRKEYNGRRQEAKKPRQSAEVFLTVSRLWINDR